MAQAHCSSGVEGEKKLMSKRIFVAISALGITGLMMAAPANAAAQAKEKTEHAVKKTGEVITDAAITTEVKTKLVAAKDVPGSKIDVDTTNGVVTLKGTVPTRAARAKAMRITRGSKGVTRVVDQLTIGAS
jgi:hyperosmotically inducible periplasmic protein